MKNFGKTKYFQFSFFTILILFLGISLIVKSLIKADKPVNHSSIPLLQVPEKAVDSLITLLTPEEKIKLLFQAENSIPVFSRDSLTEKYLQETLDQQISQQAEVDVPSDIKYCEFHRFDPQINTELAVLNSITDTLFLKKYISYILQPENTDKYSFIRFKADTHTLKALNDSAYEVFFRNQLCYYTEEIHKEYRLAGLEINFKELDRLTMFQKQEHKSKAGPSRVFDYIDAIVTDSFSAQYKLPFYYEGILVGTINHGKQADEQTILGIFHGNFDQIILGKTSIDEFVEKTNEMLASKKITINQLNAKIRKAVKARIWIEMGYRVHEDTDSIKHEPEYFNSLLSQNSINLLNNFDSAIPLKNINDRKFSIIWIGKDINEDFVTNCRHYTNPDKIHLLPGKSDWIKKTEAVQKKHFCIYVIDTLIQGEKQIEQFNDLLQKMESSSSLVINVLNYENLLLIPERIPTIQTQSGSKFDFIYAAQAIFGGIGLTACLPFNLGENYGFDRKNNSPQTRLKYGLPEEASMNALKLQEIDRIVNAAISAGAFPGCQVFVASKGQVVYHKCFGYHTYSKQNSVKETDMYDLASVTKIAATTLATMKMVSDGKISLNQPLGKFFKDTKIDYTRIKPDTVINIDTFYHSSVKNWKSFLAGRDTLNLNDTSFVTIDTIIYKLTPRLNIFKVPLIDLLRHQSGISPALPIFRYMYYKAYYIKNLKEKLTALHGKTGPAFDFKTFEVPESFPDNTKLEDSLKSAINQGFKKQYLEYFSNRYAKDSSDIRLTDNLYLKNKYFDTIWRDTKQIPVFSRKVFIYSDINMILLQMALDSLNRQSIDHYMKKNMYHPLGLRHISYLPLRYYSKNKIVPTEQERMFRYGFLHGYVHDPSAAMLGGIAGNAGLFSSAHDLGVLFQMVLNGGTYGGKNYIHPSVIKQFTTRIEETQRGLGFDMPNRKAKVGTRAPLGTYGHSGFTGTCVWVDPENEIVYVFLANRNHPNASNWRINLYNVRERVHNAVYDAIISAKDKGQKNKADGRYISSRN
jgi:beta-N-acetylhexosaminidase